MGTAPTTSDSFPRGWGPFWLHGVLGAGHMGIALSASHGEAEPASFAVQVPTPAQLSIMRQVSLAPTDWMRPDWATLTTLHHDNLVGVRAVGAFEDVPYVEFDLVDGIPASTLTTSLLLEEAVEVVRQAAAGVSALHHADYVHAHLTPGGVLVTWDGQVKVMELGIAHTLDAHLPAANPGRPTGTPYFVAPERYDGRSIPPSDVFSLGCILYQLVEGEVLLEKAAGRSKPLRGTRLEDFLTEARADKLDKRSMGLADVLLRCVHHDPEQRYASAGALATALAGLLAGSDAAEALRARMAKLRDAPHADFHEPIDDLSPIDEHDLTQPGQSGSMAALAAASGPPVWANGSSPERSGATIAPQLLVEPSPGVDHSARTPLPAPSLDDTPPPVVTPAPVAAAMPESAPAAAAAKPAPSAQAAPVATAAKPAPSSSGWKVGLAALVVLGLVGGGGTIGWQSLNGKHEPTHAPPVADVAPPTAAPAAIEAPPPAPEPVVAPPAAAPEPVGAPVVTPPPAPATRPPPVLRETTPPRVTVTRDAPAAAPRTTTRDLPPPGPRASARAPTSTTDAPPPQIGLASVTAAPVAPAAPAGPPAPSPWIDAVAPLPWYTVDDLSRVRGVVSSPNGHGGEIDAMLAEKGNSTFGPLRAAVSTADSPTLTSFVSWLDGTNRLAPFLARARRGSGGAYGPTFSAAVAQVATSRFSAAQDAAGPDQGARCDAAEHVWVAMMVEDQRKLASDWRGVCATCTNAGHALQSCDPRRLAAIGGAP